MSSKKFIIPRSDETKPLQQNNVFSTENDEIFFEDSPLLSQVISSSPQINDNTTIEEKNNFLSFNNNNHKFAKGKLSSTLVSFGDDENYIPKEDELRKNYFKNRWEKTDTGENQLEDALNLAKTNLTLSKTLEEDRLYEFISSIAGFQHRGVEDFIFPISNNLNEFVGKPYQDRYDQRRREYLEELNAAKPSFTNTVTNIPPLFTSPIPPSILTSPTITQTTIITTPSTISTITGTVTTTLSLITKSIATTTTTTSSKLEEGLELTSSKKLAGPPRPIPATFGGGGGGFLLPGLPPAPPFIPPPPPVGFVGGVPVFPPVDVALTRRLGSVEIFRHAGIDPSILTHADEAIGELSYRIPEYAGDDGPSEIKYFINSEYRAVRNLFARLVSLFMTKSRQDIPVTAYLQVARSRTLIDIQQTIKRFAIEWEWSGDEQRFVKKNPFDSIANRYSSCIINYSKQAMFPSMPPRYLKSSPHSWDFYF